MHRTVRAAVVLAVLALAVGATEPAAALGWTDRTTASATYSSGLLAPPTKPAAALGVCDLLTGDTIVLTWTATSSTWADGYEVWRSTSAGGTFTRIAVITGRLTTSYSDTSVGSSTTYYYVIRATKLAWRSVNTAAVSKTTRSSLCL